MVLDCFHGAGRIWEEIKKDGYYIKVVSIDKKPGATIRGDNLKVLDKINLNDYDIIDLDSYGIPFKQIELILNKKYYGHLFITFIQSMHGILPKKMLNTLGYTTKMIDKCKSIFNRNGLNKLKKVLTCYGIKTINYIEHGRKIYAHVKLNPE
jgi:hypothetical protein